MKNAILSFCVLLSLFLMSGTVSAHHGVQGYDRSKKVAVKGTVSEFVWANPHAQIYLQATDGKTWGLELNSPGNLTRAGWKHSSLKPGETIDATFFPGKENKGVGICVDIVKADGTKLHSQQGCTDNQAQNN